MSILTTYRQHTAAKQDRRLRAEVNRRVRPNVIDGTLFLCVDGTPVQEIDGCNAVEATERMRNLIYQHLKLQEK